MSAAEHQPFHISSSATPYYRPRHPVLARLGLHPDQLPVLSRPPATSDAASRTSRTCPYLPSTVLPSQVYREKMIHSPERNAMKMRETRGGRRGE